MIITNGKEVEKSFKKKARAVYKEELVLITETAKIFKKKAPDILRKFYNIKKSAANARIVVNRAKVKTPTAEVEFYRISREKGKNTPPSLYSFTGTKIKKKTKKKDYGVETQILKGSKQLIKKAFVIKARGNDVIVRRNEKTKKLEGLTGPSPAAMAYGKADRSLMRQPQDIIDGLVPAFFNNVLNK